MVTLLIARYHVIDGINAVYQQLPVEPDVDLLNLASITMLLRKYKTWLIIIK